MTRALFIYCFTFLGYPKIINIHSYVILQQFYCLMFTLDVYFACIYFFKYSMKQRSGSNEMPIYQYILAQMSGRHRYKNLGFQVEVYIEGKVLGMFSVQMFSYEIDVTREVSINLNRLRRNLKTKPRDTPACHLNLHSGLCWVLMWRTVY